MKRGPAPVLRIQDLQKKTILLEGNIVENKAFQNLKVTSSNNKIHSAMPKIYRADN